MIILRRLGGRRAWRASTPTLDSELGCRPDLLGGWAGW